ncbi:MAG: DinB family protein, partial [Caldilineaceae bacterium]|nr:DinB family protein [Caldilineaceae bacterium]
MTKSDMLQWLEEAQQEWQALLDEVGLARMEQPGVNGAWSMKDIVAHLAGWNHHLLNRFEAALRGKAEPPPPWPAELETDDAI